MGYSDEAVKQFDHVITNFSSERIAALRSLKMLQDIRGGTAKRKADKLPIVPAIVSLSPLMYADDVDFEVNEITLKFSEPMEESSWFYSSFSPGTLPKAISEPSFDSSKLHWKLPVKLRPGQIYAIAFNCGDAVKDIKSLKAGFRGVSGEICRPFVLVFATIDEDNIPTEIDEELIMKANQINAE
jgi:hypothetical protein